MKIPAVFDTIRPFEPEELPDVFRRLLNDVQFRQVLAYVFPDIPFEVLQAKMLQCKSSLDFQKAFCYGFLEHLLGKTAKSCDMDTKAIDTQKRYTFVSNHRDIVLDSALLDKLLLDAGFTTTCEIAIGDNLLSLPWVKDLVRVNKSFIVERDLPMRQMLLASKRLSDYMHFAIDSKNENIWIAQREGRAKDSDDRTQPAVLKMLAMGGEGSLIQRLSALHIVPLTISYEYDPCDFLKAKEFQQKRDDALFRKSPADDIVSMQTGITGYKGHIHYHCAPCIDDFLHTLGPDIPKTELFDTITAYIDRQIHRHYRLYPINYIAADRLANTDRHADRYTSDDIRQFDEYIAQRLALIDLPHRDDDFLRNRLLTMYANPVINHHRVVD